MRGPFLLCRLAFVLLVAALPVKAQERNGVLSLDAVLDWDAGGLTPRAYESRFPLGLGEDPRFRSTSQGGYSYDEAAGETAAQVREWLDDGLVNIVGGCCGTTPEHIAAIAEAVRGRVPRAVPEAKGHTLLAGLEPMVLAA